MMRNKAGVEIKKGYYAWLETQSGNRYEGVIVDIDRTSFNAKHYGPRVILDSGHNFSAETVVSVLPPMRVLKGGVVKANPVTESRELWLYARNKFEFVNASRAAFQSRASAAQWKAIALKAARSYSAEFGNGSARWRDIFTDDDLSVVGSMLRDDMQNEAEDDSLYSNPTPRIKKVTQLSQRPRISESGRPTKVPSTRLKKRRIKTGATKQKGVWANPITGAPGPFLIEKKVGSRWKVIATASTRALAFESAKAIHAAHPSYTIRVWDSRS